MAHSPRLSVTTESPSECFEDSVELAFPSRCLRPKSNSRIGNNLQIQGHEGFGVGNAWVIFINFGILGVWHSSQNRLRRSRSRSRSRSRRPCREWQWCLRSRGRPCREWCLREWCLRDFQQRSKHQHLQHPSKHQHLQHPSKHQHQQQSKHQHQHHSKHQHQHHSKHQHQHQSKQQLVRQLQQLGQLIHPKH